MYLRFIISIGEEIKVNLKKTDAIKNWQIPTNIIRMRSFAGFANFYRDFIPNFSSVAAYLLELTKKHASFSREDYQ